jgi:hypothetical protein
MDAWQRAIDFPGAEDWPQNYYRRLGFEPVGIESRFLRIIDS